MLNKDTGFKIQHVFTVPEERKFNKYAAKGTKLHSLIKENKIPFYVDRIAGGAIWHKYHFDPALIQEYIDILGNWFLGFQLHESASNRRNTDWQNIVRDMNGCYSPYDEKAQVPFAIVLPLDYACMEIPEIWDEYEFGKPRETYLRTKLSDAEKVYFGHIEELLKLAYLEKNPVGNESHTLTNSHLPDLFDIIYADASEEAFAQYEYLIDATPTGEFAKAKAGSGLKILESADLGKLEADLKKLAKDLMPCYVDDLCWLVSTDENGRRYLSIFNNDGLERSLLRGNIIHREADKEVTITFKEKTIPHVLRETMGSICLEKVDDLTYKAIIPAAGFAIINF